jgi:hypothetical protein
MYIGQGFVVVLGNGQQQLRQALKAKNVENEAGQHEGKDDRGNVENAAKALPSLALRVEEYLTVGHAVCG